MDLFDHLHENKTSMTKKPEERTEADYLKFISSYLRFKMKHEFQETLIKMKHEFQETLIQPLIEAIQEQTKSINDLLKILEGGNDGGSRDEQRWESRRGN